jgi:ligand-binding SRPBCC domain-containing protein
MRVLLKLVIDCPPDAAWQAIRSPEALTAVSSPFTVFTSLEPDGFPDQWEAGEHPVAVRAFGLVPIGEQIIGISYPPAPAGVRMMRDTGRGLSGPLALITRWEHTMAVASAPGNRTLYRDQLTFEAGPITVLMWPLYWAFWQWRALGIARLAPRWARAAR